MVTTAVERGQWTGLWSISSMKASTLLQSTHTEGDEEGVTTRATSGALLFGVIRGSGEGRRRTCSVRWPLWVPLLLVLMPVTIHSEYVSEQSIKLIIMYFSFITLCPCLECVLGWISSVLVHFRQKMTFLVYTTFPSSVLLQWCLQPAHMFLP